MTKRADRIVQTIIEEFTNIETMEKILHEDIFHSLGGAKEDEEINEIAARALLRATFAYIEAMVYCLKSMALRLSAFDIGKFTPAEKAILAENAYELDDKGRVKTQVKYIPLLKNIRFAFDAGGRALALQHKLDVGNTRWESFQKALAIRNRITHPKTVADLHISEKDSKYLEDGLEWFVDNLTAFRSEFWRRVDFIVEKKNKTADS